MERISTGIVGLDVKLGEGYPVGKAILITGAAGYREDDFRATLPPEVLHRWQETEQNRLRSGGIRGCCCY